MTLKVGEVYETPQGYQARVVATDFQPSPISGPDKAIVIVQQDGFDMTKCYELDGTPTFGDKRHREAWTLRVPPKRMWVNVFSNGGMWLHTSRSEADLQAGRIANRIACLEFKKGDGL